MTGRLGGLGKAGGLQLIDALVWSKKVKHVVLVLSLFALVMILAEIRPSAAILVYLSKHFFL